MPSQTFLHLTQEKQETIYKAARKEFSSVEFSKSSINKIIKEAGIPRGSFYMYFQDKHDLLNYVLSSFTNDLKIVLMEKLVVSNGDLSLTIIGVHDYLFKLYEDKSNQGFVKNMMLYFQSEFENLDQNRHNHQPLQEGLKRLIPYLNKSQFKDDSETSIHATVDITFSVLRSVLVNAFMQNQTIQESREQLVKYMKIIQYGYQGK